MIPLSELKTRLRWVKTNLEKSKEDYNGDFHYEIADAYFSDYCGGMVERANSEALDRSYDFVTLDGRGMGTVFTVIRNRDLFEAISHEKFSDFMADIDSLSEYPVLDDSLLSEMENNRAKDAWDEWIYSDFQKAIEKEHNTQWEINFELGEGPETRYPDLESALDEISGKDFFRLFRDLCEENNEEIIFEQGGVAWIDVEKLVESLSYKTLLEIVTGIYFVVPDAIQIPLDFGKK